MYQQKLEALIHRYFNQTERRVTCRAGNTIIEQSALNTRLYYVFSGELEGFYSEANTPQVRVFSAGSGADRKSVV